jgi:DNA-binding HxlR family transcriptional regulator
MKKTYNLACDIAQSLNILGDRWTLLIVRDLLLGKHTFNEIKASLEGISSNILSERLQSLESEGILFSDIYSTHPPRYQYKLTESGMALRFVLDAIGIWGGTYLSKTHTSIQHKECGTPVEIGYYCPECSTTVEDLSYVGIE